MVIVCSYMKNGKAEKFWSRVNKTNTCWNWIGYVNYAGYGIFYYQKEPRIKAHRYAYELTHGNIADNMLVCHSCDNRQCVRPDHLFLGTYLDNNRDCITKERNPRGERNGQSILTEKEVLEIRALKGKLSLSKLAAKYRVKPAAIGKILRGERWKHIR